ncbi:MAG: toast rack family protein [Actinomycetota bacterium]|nr:toast rack family protein [Actinomycetota bacterium]
MRAVIYLKGLVLALILVLVLAAGCARVGELRTERRSVELQEAESVRTDLSMSTGDILVGGGAENLMDATFTYNVPQWKPEISYTGLAEHKELTVKQPDVPGPTFGNIHNDWEVLLNDAVPMNLSVSNSSGDGQLDLGSLSLKSLFLDFSSGDVAADVGGDKPLLEKITVDSSSGDVGVDMTGDYTSPMGLEVDMSSGDLVMDLTGTWAQNLDGDINLSSGTTTLVFPTDVNVRVEPQTSSGDISANGMTRDGDAYVNEPYEDSDVTLNLSVQASSGDINLRLAE